MSRLFDGSDDVMTYVDASGWVSQGGAKSMLAVVKIAITTDNTWLSFVEMDQGTFELNALGRNNSSPGQVYCNRGSGSTQAASVTLTDSDGWMLIGWSIAAGTSTPRFHKIPIGGSPQHADGASTLSDINNLGDQMQIGGDADFANIYMAVAAYYNSALTDTDFEDIHDARSTQAILDLNPIWCVDDSDAFATNLADPGTGDRTAIVGTTDSADDPSGWLYFGATTAPVDYDYSRFPKPKLRELANR